MCVCAQCAHVCDFGVLCKVSTNINYYRISPFLIIIVLQSQYECFLICRTKSGSWSNQQLENKPRSSLPLEEKLPDASLLLDAPTVSSNLMSASDHFSRVAAAQAENASRKRDSNGMASSTVRSKVPRGNLPHSRNVPETSGGTLLPPQISGRFVLICFQIAVCFLTYLFICCYLFLELSMFDFKFYLNYQQILN